VLELSKGSFEIDVSKVGNNWATCPSTRRPALRQHGRRTDPDRPRLGTGAYQGITGALNVHVSAAYVLPRLENGECNTNATEFPVILIVKGSGTVTYPGNH
jgi:hypothetical protein